MGAWIGFAGVILGVIIANVNNYLVTKYQFSHQTAEEKRKFRLQRLEMAYGAVMEMQRLYSETFSHIASITFLQKVRDWQEKNILPIENLTMLITFYAPELISHLELVESLKKTLGQKIGDCLKASMSGSSQQVKESMFNEFHMSYNELDIAFKELRDALSVYARRFI